MDLRDVGFLGVQSKRSALYLQMLCAEGLAPEYALVMSDPESLTQEQQFLSDGRNLHQGYDLDEPLGETLRKNGVPFENLPTLNPNADCVVKALAQSKPQYFVYSGPGGVILTSDVLNSGKLLLHIHSGVVPDYRGSTTSYYSLLREGRCGASAFFMNDKIDQGQVIKTKWFAPPEDRTSIDVFYDSFIRASLLCEVLREYVRSGRFSSEPQASDGGETYYIIHPVLKHIAILAGDAEGE